MNRRSLAIGAVVLLAAAVVVLARPAHRPAIRRDAPSPAATRLPKLVDLGATSCVPCKAMIPVLDGLRADYAGRLEVQFIDLWKDREAGDAWRVSLMPTQVFLSPDGRELARHEGFLSREEILARWRQLGVELDPR